MRRGWIAGSLSGVLIGISLLPTDRIPLGHWPIFFGFVPLWNFLLNEPSGKRRFLAGWLTQFIFTLFAFNWIAHTVHEFSFLPWPVSFLVLFLFCGIANLFVPLAGWLGGKLFPAGRFGDPSRIFALFLLTAIGERIYPMIFEWNFGYVWFYQRWPGFHFADVVGFRGLSTISLLVNALVLLAWRKKFSAQKAGWWLPLAGASLLLLAVNWAGSYRRMQLPEPDRMLKALVVQANIGNKQKHQAEHGEKYREAIIGKYLALTERGLASNPARPDFVLWPENAFPDLLLEPSMKEGRSPILAELTKAHKVPLITGAFGFNGEDSITNSVFVIGADGRWLSEPYKKTVLLPFGEYIPGARIFPWLKKLLPHVRDFGVGSGPRLTQAGDWKLGIQICYEGLFDWFANSLARAGANFIVNVTNDSWYGDWEQPYQHFFMTLGRAVETRLPLLRSTNTGISGLALASGEIVAPSPLHQEWTHLFEIPYVENPELTPFVRYGYWLVPALLWLSLIGLCLSGRRNRPGPGRESSSLRP